MKEEGYKRLAFAIVKQAVEDCMTLAENDNFLLARMTNMPSGGGYFLLYKQHKQNLNELERFYKWFKGADCELYLQDKISGDRIIRELKNKKREDYKRKLKNWI